MAHRLIWISVEESGSGPEAAFSFHVRLDREVVAANQALTSAQSRAVRELSRQYGQLFEQQRPPQLAREALTVIGTQLFDLFLASLYPRLSAKLRLSDQRMLVIGSGHAAVLNLPWELLRQPGGEAIGADAKWSVRRLPWADRPLDPAEDRLPPGPLRVLHMVAAPSDQAELDFEREEELLLGERADPGSASEKDREARRGREVGADRGADARLHRRGSGELGQRGDVAGD